MRTASIAEPEPGSSTACPRRQMRPRPGAPQTACKRLYGGGRGAKAREQVGHLERRKRGLGALVSLRPARALLRLPAAVAGEDAEGDGNTRLEPGELEPARGLAGDVLEVRRVAADHAAESDDAGVAPGLCKRHRAERELEGARDRHDVDPLLRHSGLGQRLKGALEESGRDVAVEAADDDADRAVRAVRRAGDDADSLRDAELSRRVLHVSHSSPPRSERPGGAADGRAFRAWSPDTGGSRRWARSRSAPARRR